MPHHETSFAGSPWDEIFHVAVVAVKGLAGVLRVCDDLSSDFEAT